MSFFPNAFGAKINMFTGIIRTVGTVIKIEKNTGHFFLVIKHHNKIGRLKLGDSVAVNGVCLTVGKINPTTLTCEIMLETIRKTTLGFLKEKDLVNLEPALRVGEPLGGHIVQGHVDAVAKIISLQTDGKNLLAKVSFPKSLTPFIVRHGSIALDGISLTVARRQGNMLTISLLIETLKRTNWKKIFASQLVNLEVDVLGKYVQQIITYKT